MLNVNDRLTGQSFRFNRGKQHSGITLSTETREDAFERERVI